MRPRAQRPLSARHSSSDVPLAHHHLHSHIIPRPLLRVHPSSRRIDLGAFFSSLTLSIEAISPSFHCGKPASSFVKHAQPLAITCQSISTSRDRIIPSSTETTTKYLHTEAYSYARKQHTRFDGNPPSWPPFVKAQLDFSCRQPRYTHTSRK